VRALIRHVEADEADEGRVDGDEQGEPEIDMTARANRIVKLMRGGGEGSHMIITDGPRPVQLFNLKVSSSYYLPNPNPSLARP